MNVCLDCQLGKILEGGVPSVAIQSSHAMCAGVPENPCLCGCDFALRKRCRLCFRPRQALDLTGVCADHEACAKETAKQLAEDYHARQERLAEAGGRKRSRSAAEATGVATGVKSGTCLCGCGEKTGSWFRPGHDSRFVSSLVAAVQAGEMTADEARSKVGHSAALVAKVTKRLG